VEGVAQHRVLRLTLAVLAVSALGWLFASWLAVPRPVNALEELSDVRQLAQRFDADREYARVVLLLSPT
jgi:hypothetical protein